MIHEHLQNSNFLYITYFLREYLVLKNVSCYRISSPYHPRHGRDRYLSGQDLCLGWRAIPVSSELKLSWRHIAVGIVDDNSEWRRTVRAMVMSFGANDIIEAVDGGDFLQKSGERGSGLDLLLVDDEMTPMDGFVVMHALRSKADQLSRRAAAILMAGHGSAEIVKRALDVGYHSVLPKPFSSSVPEAHASKVLMRPVQWREEGGLLCPVAISQG
jgi:CheY-like chemotaxis protein